MFVVRSGSVHTTTLNAEVERRVCCFRIQKRPVWCDDVGPCGAQSGT